MLMEPQPLLIDGKQAKAILCMLKTNVHDHTFYRIRLDELRRLVESLGVEVVGEVVQSRFKPFSKYYVGSGKVKELARKSKSLGANMVIFYNILKSSQKLNLMKALGVEVIDRHELALEIFDQMASDRLSKLQIQAARLEKMEPFYKLQASINYREERPFFRAGGEYAFHGQLREISRAQARISKEIDRLMEEKKRRIFKRRRELGYPVVCIAGFYNAGKTSLFNALTGDNKTVSSRPFTTLSSKYQRRYIDHETTVLFIDTIGFMLDLDPRLIGSFKLNLLDMKSSDLVLLLLDLSDQLEALKLKIVEGVRILRSIGVERERIILVFNKVDKNPSRCGELPDALSLDQFRLPWICISAKERTNLEGLLELIDEKLAALGEPPPLDWVEDVSVRHRRAVNKLLEWYGAPPPHQPQPPFPSLVRTILSQNTSSPNTQQAYKRLEESIGLDPSKIAKAPLESLQEAIKPAGMWRLKARTIQAAARMALEEGGLDHVFNKPLAAARERLMEIPGVGPKTADVALLFSVGAPVVPVDRHVERVAKRLGVVRREAGYEETRKALEDLATPDRFRDLHLALVKLGRTICRPSNPRHGECPLRDLCPQAQE